MSSIDAAMLKAVSARLSGTLDRLLPGQRRISDEHFLSGDEGSDGEAPDWLPHLRALVELLQVEQVGDCANKVSGLLIYHDLIRILPRLIQGCLRCTLLDSCSTEIPMSIVVTFRLLPSCLPLDSTMMNV